jgi:hypothetical protein
MFFFPFLIYLIDQVNRCRKYWLPPLMSPFPNCNQPFCHPSCYIDEPFIECRYSPSWLIAFACRGYYFSLVLFIIIIIIFVVDVLIFPSPLSFVFWPHLSLLTPTTDYDEKKEITVICCRSRITPNVYYHNWGNNKIRKKKSHYHQPVVGLVKQLQSIVWIHIFCCWLTVHPCRSVNKKKKKKTHWYFTLWQGEKKKKNSFRTKEKRVRNKINSLIMDYNQFYATKKRIYIHVCLFSEVHFRL